MCAVYFYVWRAGSSKHYNFTKNWRKLIFHVSRSTNDCIECIRSYHNTFIIWIAIHSRVPLHFRSVRRRYRGYDVWIIVAFFTLNPTCVWRAKATSLDWESIYVISTTLLPTRRAARGPTEYACPMCLQWNNIWPLNCSPPPAGWR